MSRRPTVVVVRPDGVIASLNRPADPPPTLEAALRPALISRSR
jgi:hypothetical protein